MRRCGSTATRSAVINGAFNRGRFDVASLLTPGDNVLAVLISPPDHPGIPHEQSLADGPGENGGLMAIDGPTFADTEGWDWIPAIRDRDMGIWQDVTLSAQGPVSLDTPQIITTLPLPDTSRAAITLRVPLNNETQQPLHATLELAFEGVTISKPVTIAPGASTVTLTPGDTPQLNIAHPRLWWPNGYGSPELYHLTASLRIGNRALRPASTSASASASSPTSSRCSTPPAIFAASKSTPPAPHSPTNRSSTRHTKAFARLRSDGSHSLTPAGEHSPAVHDTNDLATQPALVIRVNGVRIAVRGGASGMEDMLKRVSRSRLEPFFRLQRDAHMNIVRNWMGQNTEESFFDLADEYGLLVWNDFWDSTQDYNLEPDDSALFLRNARDTILRFRNHPSIAVWCGRNEGVPAPAVNQGLIDLIAQLDGTRLYSASSNRVNLHDSGPYKYQEPSEYFTHLALGFAVEIGLPSPPTLEAFESFLPKEDQWPISDDWAYHDWHQGGNGDTAVFMKAMNEQLGPPSSLADFDRKAQMLNYVSHRAVFEGFNAHLWNPNSGRMLWMTQPAWPSTEWQIFSHDYDTHAAFYGVKIASEPIHIQLDLPNYEIAIINNTTAALPQLSVHAQVFDLSSKLLFERSATVDAAANANNRRSASHSKTHSLTNPVVFVKLTLADATGKPLSQNFYWLAAHDYDFRKLNDLPAVTLQASATIESERLRTTHQRHADQPLADHRAHHQAHAARGARRPAHPSRLLQRQLHLAAAERAAHDRHHLPVLARAHAPRRRVRGWNITPATIDVSKP